MTAKALAIADGEGHNGVFLAECGLEVLSIDFADRPEGALCAANGGAGDAHRRHPPLGLARPNST